MDKSKIVTTDVIAVCIIKKIKNRIKEIEKLKVGELTKPVIKEWRRLKALEKNMM